MRTTFAAFAALMPCAAFAAAGSDEPAVSGDYVEARTCDIFTGPCFANGEMNLAGRQGIAAWKVGTWIGLAKSGAMWSSAD